MAHWTETGPQKCHILAADFSLTTRDYTNQNHYLTKPMFDYGKPNKQTGKREWLIYLPSQKKVKCFYCHLFSDTKKWGTFCEGFRDWKNTAYVTSHAMSEQHTLTISSYHTPKKLTVILHYVLPSGAAEHFETFINIISHTGEKLASYLFDFLTENGIDISLCRDQSYDNTSSMSGKYSGRQAKLKERNALVGYMPGTWWNASTEAVPAAVLGYPNILEALKSIRDDESQKSATRKDAKILSDAMHTLETGILCEVWNDTLQPFSRCSLSLQSAQIDFSIAVNLMRSLGTVLQQLRDSFDEYEIQESAKRRKRQKTCDNVTAHSFSDKEASRVNTFITIINKLKSSLEYWTEAYENIDKTFSVRTHFSPNISSSEVSEEEGAASSLASAKSVFSRKALVKMQLLKDVVGSDTYRINNKYDDAYTPLPVEEIIRRSEFLIGQEVSYDLLGNNCEHFVTLLRYGEGVSEQANRAISAIGFVTAAAGAVSLLGFFQNKSREQHY
ncbi:unnamed protein product [Caretta caretta]